MAGSKGEGSRGGKIIGHTKSGFPIYASSLAISSGVGAAVISRRMISKRMSHISIANKILSRQVFTPAHAKDIEETVQKYGSQIKKLKSIRAAGVAIAAIGLYSAVKAARKKK